MTTRGAVLMIAASGLLTIAVTGWLTPLMQGDIRDALYEAMYQRDVENDRAGRISYPATALREVRPTTPEERARLREQFRQNPRYLAAQAERTRPRWNRSTFMTGALAIAMGSLNATQLCSLASVAGSNPCAASAAGPNTAHAMRATLLPASGSGL